MRRSIQVHVRTTLPVSCDPMRDPPDLFQWQTAGGFIGAGVAGPSGDTARHPLRDAAVDEPGYAAMRFEQKLAQWRIVRRAAVRIEGGQVERLDEDRERPLPVAVRTQELSDEALRGVVESFVLREGTDYGERDVSTRKKSRR